MEQRIVDFIAGLRAAGVRISIAESADAFRAVETLGVQDRDRFRIALRSTLIKEPQDVPTFEQLFPLYFGADAPPAMLNSADDLSPEEMRMLAEAIRQFTGRLREMLQRLLQGKPLSQEELDQLGQLVGLRQADHPALSRWMAQRMLRALGMPEVQEALQELWQLLNQMGMNRQTLERLQGLVQANMDALQEQVERFAGASIARNLADEGRPQAGPDLMHRPFRYLSDAEAEELRKQIRRLAALLRSRLALRHKRGKTGKLDAKATLRANQRFGGVPLDIRFKQRHLKPKLALICDVSTSMRHCAEFMLTLIYELQDQVGRARSFAFIADMEEISQAFAELPTQRAVEEVLTRLPPGYYNTDLGNSLATFSRRYMDAVDHRTTVIVLGDARNNYNNPRLDLLQEIKRRSRRIIWLNPEPPAMWGSGDSDMLSYLPLVDAAFEVGNLAQLTVAVDRLLSS
ncbi:MAG: VWA domain-containing protein [Caldilineales bacterium]|nr:VWA domain-containing protein [Caldilineales bacterium]MDW8317482.1 VWA domain-containing protein [Anaerolineae bacterium]